MDLIAANLLIEYIGYEYFIKAIKQVKPVYVSCGIQINMDAGFVSDSPYIHVFDYLDSIHHQISEPELIKAMSDIEYHMVLEDEKKLPNRKKLVRLDFRR